MVRYAWMIAAASLLGFGCGMIPMPRAEREALSPSVRISPVFELFAYGTPKLRPRVVVDSAGNGHVIAAASDSKTVYHILVEPDGVLHQEIIVSSVAPSHIDAALDRAGMLHVLVGTLHFTRKEDGWQISEQNPWRTSGVDVMYPRFVPGATDLVWAFMVGGREVGGPKRWDLTGAIVGGPAAALPLFWVWPTYGRKLVVAAETDAGPAVWSVLDREEKSDSDNCRFAVSAGGKVQIVYDSSRGGSLATNLPRYAQFHLNEPLIVPFTAPDIANDPRSSVSLRAISGITLEGVHDRRGVSGFGSQSAVAADPDTGTLLVLKAHDWSWLVRNGIWSKPLQIPFSSSGPWEPRLAPAGGERFHALLLGKGSHVFYLEFFGETWSAPLDIGVAYTTSFWSWFGEGLELGSDGKGLALAVWPVKGGIAGRWLDARLSVQKDE